MVSCPLLSGLSASPSRFRLVSRSVVAGGFVCSGVRLRYCPAFLFVWSLARGSWCRLLLLFVSSLCPSLFVAVFRYVCFGFSAGMHWVLRWLIPSVGSFASTFVPCVPLLACCFFPCCAVLPAFLFWVTIATCALVRRVSFFWLVCRLPGRIWAFSLCLPGPLTPCAWWRTFSSCGLPVSASFGCFIRCTVCAPLSLFRGRFPLPCILLCRI